MEKEGDAAGRTMSVSGEHRIVRQRRDNEQDEQKDSYSGNPLSTKCWFHIDLLFNNYSTFI
jgi:hypothetical protein